MRFVKQELLDEPEKRNEMGEGFFREARPNRSGFRSVLKPVTQFA